MTTRIERDIAYKEFRSRMIQYAYTEWCEKLDALYIQGIFSEERFANLMMHIFMTELGVDMDQHWPQVCKDIEDIIVPIKEKSILTRDFQNL